MARKTNSKLEGAFADLAQAFADALIAEIGRARLAELHEETRGETPKTAPRKTSVTSAKKSVKKAKTQATSGDAKKKTKTQATSGDAKKKTKKATGRASR